MKSKILFVIVFLMSGWVWGKDLPSDIKNIVKEQGVSGVGGGGDLAETEFRRLWKEMYQTFTINHISTVSIKGVEEIEVVSIEKLEEAIHAEIYTTDRTDGSLKLNGDRKDGRNLPGVAIVFDITDWKTETLDGKRQFVIHELLLYKKLPDPEREVSRQVLIKFNELKKSTIQVQSYDCTLAKSIETKFINFQKKFGSQKIPSVTEDVFNLVDEYAGDLATLVKFEDQTKQMENDSVKEGFSKMFKSMDQVKGALQAKKHTIVFLSLQKSEMFFSGLLYLTPPKLVADVVIERTKVCQ